MKKQIKIILFYIAMLLSSSAVLAQDITASFVGVSIHGFTVDKDVALKKMKNKLDKRAIFAFNPQLSLAFNTSKNYTISFSYLKDCYNADAYHIALGKKWNIFTNTRVGALIGFYTYKPTTDVVDVKMGNIGDNVFSFYPWGLIEQNIPIYKDLSLNLTLVSNILLTHINTGLNYKF